jgi:hypothetical protein
MIFRRKLDKSCDGRLHVTTPRESAIKPEDHRTAQGGEEQVDVRLAQVVL